MHRFKGIQRAENLGSAGTPMLCLPPAANFPPLVLYGQDIFIPLSSWTSQERASAAMHVVLVRWESMLTTWALQRKKNMIESGRNLHQYVMYGEHNCGHIFIPSTIHCSASKFCITKRNFGGFKQSEYAAFTRGGWKETRSLSTRTRFGHTQSQSYSSTVSIVFAHEDNRTSRYVAWALENRALPLEGI